MSQRKPKPPGLPLRVALRQLRDRYAAEARGAEEAGDDEYAET